MLAYPREYDPVAYSLLQVVPFDETHPAAVPLHAEVLAPALECARGELEGRILSYSAKSRGLGESSRKEDFECSPCRTSFAYQPR